MIRKLAIYITLVVVGMSAVADSGPRGRPRDRDGSYAVTIAGDYAGSGQSSSVSDDRLKLNATVRGPGGTGLLNANLTLDGGHFSGSGNVLGSPAEFKGRLDVPDDDRERAIKGVRLVCTFTVNTDGGKRYGRLIGYIPSLAAAVDDDRDRNRTRR